jgi:NAD(P)-dependent dehydrogenase (short-subunit alcohol dehydrogenase family)
MGEARFSFENEVVVITGGVSGIGRAAVAKFVKARAKVAIVDRDSTGLRACESEFGDRCLALKCDVTDNDELITTMDEILRGLGAVGVLVNSAGMSARMAAQEYPLGDMDRLMSLNVRALFSAMQICARSWIGSGRPGVIVNLASIFGLIADPLSAPYAASKGAVIQLTKTCAVEWAPYGIRVNAVAPGYTYTNMTAATLESEAGKNILEQVPMKRAARVDEIADAILFLASSSSSFITGHTLVVDGGRTAV